MYLKIKLEGVEWLNLDQDMENQRTLINTLINNLLVQDVGKYQLLKKGISMELVFDTATIKTGTSEGPDFLLLQASTSQTGVEVILPVICCFTHL